MTHLLVLRFSAMGDVALLVPVVQALTQRYPDLSVTVVTRAKFAVFFGSIPRVRVIEADFGGTHNGFAGLLRLFKELKSLGADKVVDAHQNLRSAILKSLFLATGVPSVTIDKGRADKKALTRKEHKIRLLLPHSIERYARVFARAGFPLQPARPFQFAPFPSADAELTDFLDRHQPNPSESWLGIAPFAQHPQKMWPFDRFAPLLERLYSNQTLQVFLFGGGPAEIAQLNTLQLQFPQAIVVAGQLSLAAELALIARLSGMVCMDSGNMHLAALSGVPVLSIWGATHPDAGFGPWGQGSEAIVQIPVEELTCRPCSIFGNVPCYRGDLACLNWISADAVANRVRQMLALPD